MGVEDKNRMKSVKSCKTGRQIPFLVLDGYDDGDGKERGVGHETPARAAATRGCDVFRTVIRAQGKNRHPNLQNNKSINFVLATNSTANLLDRIPNALGH
jgi:hypothetical protein